MRTAVGGVYVSARARALFAIYGLRSLVRRLRAGKHAHILGFSATTETEQGIGTRYHCKRCGQMLPYSEFRRPPSGHTTTSQE